jgi:hypothetical protein
VVVLLADGDGPVDRFNGAFLGFFGGAKLNTDGKAFGLIVLRPNCWWKSFGKTCSEQMTAVTPGCQRLYVFCQVF